MSTSSTSQENPVNQIAALFAETEQLVEKPETPSTDNVDVNTQEDTADENQETVESLEAVDETVDENQDTVTETAEPDVDTLNNLAEELDVPIADMYALNVKMSEGDDITLGTLKDFYESNTDVETIRQQLKSREDELTADAELMRQAPQVSNELLQARAAVLSIESQYNNTDWDSLRASDPGTYAAMQQDFRIQFDLAKQAEATATESVSTHQEQARKMQQDRLFEAIPQLKEEAYRKEALDNVLTFTAKYGFTQSDVDNIEDNRLMRLLIEASRVTNAVETAKGKLETPTTTGTKPSASRPTVSSRAASLKRLTERAKATGDRRHQTDAVSALLNS